MNRFLFAIAIAIPLAAVLFVVSSKDKQEKAEAEAEAQTTEEVVETKAEKELAIKVTAENFDELVLNSDQAVLLDFWAPWCGPCMMLGPHVETIAAEYEGQLVVGKVNTDEQQELAVKYKASSIPLVLILKDGEVVGQVGGFSSETPDEIRKVIDGVIKL